MASPEFSRLSPGWRTATRKYVSLIGEDIDFMTLGDLSTKEAKREFWALRDRFADTPAKADKLVSVLRRVLGWAYLRDMIDYNHADKIERLVPSTHSRADLVWTGDDEADFLTRASQPVAEAFQLALYTLARESDLIGLKWEQFDGRWLVYKPSKTAHSTAPTVHLPVYRLEPLRELVANLSRCTDYLLTTEKAAPWKAANLSHQFTKYRALSRLSNPTLNWHDLRGTGITRLYMAGCTDAEVASISGHVMGDRAQQRSYVARTRELAEHAYDKWNRWLQHGSSVVRLFPATT